MECVKVLACLCAYVVRDAYSFLFWTTTTHPSVMPFVDCYIFSSILPPIAQNGTNAIRITIGLQA